MPHMLLSNSFSLLLVLVIRLIKNIDSCFYYDDNFRLIYYANNQNFTIIFIGFSFYSKNPTCEGVRL